jgi:hypothetical protein
VKLARGAADEARCHATRLKDRVSHQGDQGPSRMGAAGTATIMGPRDTLRDDRARLRAGVDLGGVSRAGGAGAQSRCDGHMESNPLRHPSGVERCAELQVGRRGLERHRLELDNPETRSS